MSQHPSTACECLPSSYCVDACTFSQFRFKQSYHPKISMLPSFLHSCKQTLHQTTLLCLNVLSIPVRGPFFCRIDQSEDLPLVPGKIPHSHSIPATLTSPSSLVSFSNRIRCPVPLLHKPLQTSSNLIESPTYLIPNTGSNSNPSF